MTKVDFKEIYDQAETVSKMDSGFIKYLKKSLNQLNKHNKPTNSINSTNPTNSTNPINSTNSEPNKLNKLQKTRMPKFSKALDKYKKERNLTSTQILNLEDTQVAEE